MIPATPKLRLDPIAAIARSENGKRESKWRYASRTAVLTVFGALLIWLAAMSVQGSMRDNDQASLVSGALRITQGEESPFSALLYNYDKQWGSYLLLAGMTFLTPNLDPVMRGNLLQLGLLVTAMILVLLWLYRSPKVPLWTVLPILASPALILYIPFFATASLSLGYLFLSLVLLRDRSRVNCLVWAPLAITLAAACRGDVLLITPAIILSSSPRLRLPSLVKQKGNWLIFVAALLPVGIGRIIDGKREADIAGFYFNPKVFVAFLIFGLGLATIILFFIFLGSRLSLFPRRRGRTFYACEVLAALVPVGFYWSQLYSPRYFYLTIASMLFLLSSRRSALLFSKKHVGIAWLVGATAILLYFIGLSVPSTRSITATLQYPTIFPTADGAFPMGGYLRFIVYGIRNQFLFDHNEKTWQEAKTVNFHSCGGVVPFLGSPMASYMDFAARLQNKSPLWMVSLSMSPCSGAYVDLRALATSYSDDPLVAKSNITVVSQRPELGRPIVWLEEGQPLSPESQTINEVIRYFRGKDFELLIGDSQTKQSYPNPGTDQTYFSFGGCCGDVKNFVYLCKASRQTGCVVSGSARAVFPDYMPK